MYRGLSSDNKLYNLLDLIEKGDSLAILSEEKLTDSFNELLRNDLISITDGKVQLTEKGRMVYNGREKFVMKPQKEDEIIDFFEAGGKKSRRLFYLSLFVLLLCLVGLSIIFVIN